MPQVCYYSPAERQREKERQRHADELALRASHVSPEDLRVRNGFFSSIEVVRSEIVCQDSFD